MTPALWMTASKRPIRSSRSASRTVWSRSARPAKTTARRALAAIFRCDLLPVVRIDYAEHVLQAKRCTGRWIISSREKGVVGTVVRFTSGPDTIDVVIGENTPATRDFVSMLPLTLELREFNGREKSADLPREPHHQGSPGSDPEDGDVICFIPWGNFGFYYDTAGIGYSDQTLHLGTYEATGEELALFEGKQTTVDVVNR